MNKILESKIRIAIMEFSQSHDILVKEYKDGLPLDEYSDMYDRLVDNYAKRIMKYVQEEK